MRRFANKSALVLILMACAATAQTAQGSLTFNISVAQSTFHIGSPIVVNVLLKNISDHDTTRMGVGGGDAHDEIAGFPPIVRNAEGQEPPLTKWGRTVFSKTTPEDNSPGFVLNAVGPVAMHPGEILRTKINLNELFDLSKPGRYTVQVRHFDDERREEVKSNTITLVVVP